MSSPAALINLLYPPACLLCHGHFHSRASREIEEQVLCDDCVGGMPRNGPPLCSRCGLELPGAFDAILQCAACRRRPPVFEVAKAPWQYAGPARDAIRQFKYHRRWRMGRWLAQEMVTTAHSFLPLEEEVFVASVPLHWIKRRFKGFNPAEQLACTVARTLQKPYLPNALRRTRWTATQTRLPWRQRARNVREAFVSDERLVRNRSVLLIDDVLTSGATANACASALKEAGVRRVFVLTAARTPLYD